MVHNIVYGALAQSVEHLTFNQVVRGSNPRCLIINKDVTICLVAFFLFLIIYKSYVVLKSEYRVLPD